MKQHITENQLNELSYEQKEKLRYLWIPKENDLAVAYICKDAELQEYDIIPFTIGKVECDEFEPKGRYNTRKSNFSMVLRSKRLLDDSYYEDINKVDDIVEESELEYEPPEDYFSFEYCLPLLNIGQMMEVLSKDYYYGFDFFINYRTSESKYEIGRRMVTYNEQNIEYIAIELCDGLWESLKSLL